MVNAQLVFAIVNAIFFPHLLFLWIPAILFSRVKGNDKKVRIFNITCLVTGNYYFLNTKQYNLSRI